MTWLCAVDGTRSLCGLIPTWTFSVEMKMEHLKVDMKSELKEKDC